MASFTDTRRRRLGVICVAIAAGMLLLGLTAFKGRLQPQSFVIYWLTCTVFTGLTMLIALLDLRAVRRRSRQEESELLKTVLRDFSPDDVKQSKK